METPEKATPLQTYEGYCDKNNELATNGIRSCESKQTEQENEQETEGVREEEKSEEENGTDGRGNEKEETKEELIQNSEESQISEQFFN